MEAPLFLTCGRASAAGKNRTCQAAVAFGNFRAAGEAVPQVPSRSSPRGCQVPRTIRRVRCLEEPLNADSVGPRGYSRLDSPRVVGTWRNGVSPMRWPRPATARHQGWSNRPPFPSWSLRRLVWSGRIPRGSERMTRSSFGTSWSTRSTTISPSHQNTGFR